MGAAPLCSKCFGEDSEAPKSREEGTRLLAEAHASTAGGGDFVGAPRQLVLQTEASSPRSSSSSSRFREQPLVSSSGGSRRAARSRGGADSAPPGDAKVEGSQRLVELPGHRRSLLVGINYHGTTSELSGCVNDVHRVRTAIAQRWGFAEDACSSQRVLIDEPGMAPDRRPTLDNLRTAIAWLVEGARTGDALYFHYSGHGGRVANSRGGYHETLCPVDFSTAGMLADCELFDILVKPLPIGCRLTCVLDCCHSAGALDLPYLFAGTNENLDRALAGESLEMAMSINWARDVASWQEGSASDLMGDCTSMGLGLWELFQKRQAANEAGGVADTDATQNAGVAVGEVIAFMGCRSDQTSADVGDVQEQFDAHLSGPQVRASEHAGGALTAVFLESLQREELSYLDLLERMRHRLQETGFTQVPLLASSLFVELHQRFSLTTAFLPRHPAKGGSASSRSVDSAQLGSRDSCAAGFLSALAAAPDGSDLLGSSHEAAHDSEDSEPHPAASGIPTTDLLDLSGSGSTPNGAAAWGGSSPIGEDDEGDGRGLGMGTGSWGRSPTSDQGLGAASFGTWNGPAASGASSWEAERWRWANPGIADTDADSHADAHTDGHGHGGGDDIADGQADGHTDTHANSHGNSRTDAAAGRSDSLTNSHGDSCADGHTKHGEDGAEKRPLHDARATDVEYVKEQEDGGHIVQVADVKEVKDAEELDEAWQGEKGEEAETAREAEGGPDLEDARDEKAEMDGDEQN